MSNPFNNHTIMRDRYSAFLLLLILLALTSSSDNNVIIVDAFPNQAGNCPANRAAVGASGSPHVDRSRNKGVSNGRLSEGMFVINRRNFKTTKTIRIKDGGVIKMEADGRRKFLQLAALGRRPGGKPNNFRKY